MFGFFEKKKSPYADTFGKGRVIMVSGCKVVVTPADLIWSFPPLKGAAF